MESIYLYLGIFIVLLFLGVPVAFSLGFPALLYIIFYLGTTITFLPQTILAPVQSFTLLALPCFLLAGRLMNTAGITTRLLRFSVAVFGRVKGGLAYANSLASMIFASMSGTAIGDAGGIGYVLFKMMERSGYKRDFAAGITAGTSVVGPIIPPSAAMVILGAVSQISVGRLFLSGVVPGIVMVGLIMLTIYGLSVYTKDGRDWPVEKLPFKEVTKSFMLALFPLLTPVIILGGIILGIVTPTEAAVLAINYAVLLGLFYQELSFKNIWETLESAVVTTGTFMLIISIAGLFTWMLTREGLTRILTDMIMGYVGYGDTYLIAIIALMLIFLGMVLDTTAAIMIICPILFPIIRLTDIDPVHFGLVTIIALVIGIITPPYGIVLFVVSEVSGVPVSSVTKHAIRFVPAMVITLIIVIVFPKLSLWLPNLIMH